MFFSFYKLKNSFPILGAQNKINTKNFQILFLAIDLKVKMEVFSNFQQRKI